MNNEILEKYINKNKLKSFEHLPRNVMNKITGKEIFELDYYDYLSLDDTIRNNIVKCLYVVAVPSWEADVVTMYSYIVLDYRGDINNEYLCRDYTEMVSRLEDIAITH